MRKITFSKKESRILIVVIAINLFALFINYFGLSPKFELSGSHQTDYGENYTKRDGENSIYLFSDSGENTIIGNSNPVGASLYKTRYTKHFWPFTKFNENETKVVNNYDGDWNYNKEGHTFYYYAKRFRGIFADYDHTEFLVYTLLIFGIVTIRKIW
ncbi:hypothetical protein I2486_08580 [Cellulophaga sp. E16_2]|uniref:hypothetical protein n=1 Tax=Cellulophaga sp. E16_2 TaxID=2789297 RepID=UPI001A939773|nr:hypothetical protein [Cellulophaga sp. E16_2]MBO0591462.1 hypothetical protein [Cellulophaga sp. E16_2]